MPKDDYIEKNRKNSISDILYIYSSFFGWPYWFIQVIIIIFERGIDFYISYTGELWQKVTFVCNKSLFSLK